MAFRLHASQLRWQRHRRHHHHHHDALVYISAIGDDKNNDISVGGGGGSAIDTISVWRLTLNPCSYFYWFLLFHSISRNSFRGNYAESRQVVARHARASLPIVTSLPTPQSARANARAWQAHNDCRDLAMAIQL